MHAALSPSVKLAANIRFLATVWICSTSFVSRGTLGKIILDVVDAVYDNLKKKIFEGAFHFIFYIKTNFKK